MTEPENTPEQPNPLLDLDDDKPLLCPTQKLAYAEDEICEACQ